ncbi:MAG: 4Fe-4S binding protein, partial [Halobacteriota archaeon]|nr:4Fe-4S binding protein [Halobacteriota archaeon]
AESVKNFSDKLEPSPIRRDKIRNRKSPDPEITKLGKREIIIDTLRNLSLKTGISLDVIEVDREGIPFRDISIGETCTICNSCSELCKTGALIKDTDKISFIHGYCIACGICESTCPESAIELKPVIDFKRLTSTDAKLMKESEMVECKKCGRPFITRSALEKISGVVSGGEVHEFGVEDHLDLIKYCDKCRPIVALKKIRVEK